MSEKVLTGYAASKIINEVLVAANLPQIPPQMVYNYTSARIRAGKSPFIECDADGHPTPEGVNKWLAKYISKKQGVTANENQPTLEEGAAE